MRSTSAPYSWLKCVVLLALITLLVAVAGCGSGANNQPTEPTKAPASATIAFAQKISTLDPDQPIANSDLNALHQIGGGLYEQRAGGKIVPALAMKSTLSADRRTWTFQLRTDLKFSDGTPVTAADVVASFKRALADKANINGAIIAPISSVSQKGEDQVEIVTKRPYPSLPAVLSEEGFIVFPASGLAQGSKFFNTPISFGPYMIATRAGDTATFKINPYYWGPKPKIATLVFQAIPDASSRLSQLRAGQVDYVFDLPPSMLATLEKASSITTTVVPSYGWYSLSMWNPAPPLNDSRIRKAISLAIDRQKIVDAIWHGKNKPVSSFWPPTMMGYEPGLETPNADPVAAKKLLAGTAFASGGKLTLKYSTAVTPFADQMALMIQQNLAAIGIRVQLANIDGTAFVSDLFSGKYQLGLYGLADFIPQPDGLLPYGLSSTGGVNANFTGYKSADTEKLITATLSSSDQARTAYLQKVNQRFLEDQPFATLATWAYVSASRLPASLISTQPSLLFEIAREPNQ
jgi:peptide/nickel transport system substrate-binding protein